MRDRARIYRHADGKWRAIRPGYGFNTPEESSPLDSHAAAIAWLDGCRTSSESGSYELSGQVHDAIGSLSMWTPLWPQHWP
jgi:hypothetical protein